MKSPLINTHLDPPPLRLASRLQLRLDLLDKHCLLVDEDIHPGRPHKHVLGNLMRAREDETHPLTPHVLGPHRLDVAIVQRREHGEGVLGGRSFPLRRATTTTAPSRDPPPRLLMWLQPQIANRIESHGGSDPLLLPAAALGLRGGDGERAPRGEAAGGQQGRIGAVPRGGVRPQVPHGGVDVVVGRREDVLGRVAVREADDHGARLARQLVAEGGVVLGPAAHEGAAVDVDVEGAEFVVILPWGIG